METSKKTIYKDKIFLIGILLTILSVIIFSLPLISSINIKRDSYFGIFFFNYAITVSYCILLFINGFIKFRFSLFKNNIEYTLVFLVLALISAFSLNREIPIFERSADWVSIFLVVQCVTMLLFGLRAVLPKFVSHILYCSLGAGLIIYAYFAIYLVPFYVIGLFGGVFFGMSLHVFVPLLFLIFSFLLIIRAIKENKFYGISIITGSLLTMLVAISFLYKWQQLKTKISYTINKSITEESNLPLWTSISQRMDKCSIFEKMIKADLVYSTPNENSFSGWGMPQRSFDEVKKHDPLVMTACLFFGKPELSDDERIKILESVYDSRHQAQERFWSGDKLETSNVISNIKLFPEYRMAYTEKTLSVKNNGARDGWRNEQEAIYTFHLPEGGVVTSLSLWINGKEENAILTTKSKADSAYRTIVGVELRDPSVVHWQEGNTVSVRVFPCTPSENRRFKIGVTTPLKKKENKLVYQNIYFDGPSGENATESIQLQFSEKPNDLTLPFDFTEVKPNAFQFDSDYRPYWEFELSAPLVSNHAFSTDSCSYQMSNYRKVYTDFSPDKVYIDLNKAWEKEEFVNVCAALKGKKIYVYDDKILEVTDENRNMLYAALSKYNFSLFPFYKISGNGNVLIISKSTETSPSLKDLKDSRFSEKLATALATKSDIRLFSISDELTPYLKTLKELRVFTYDNGSIEDLVSLLKTSKFVASQEDSSTVVIDNSQVKITESEHADANGKAPDHLFRLFAYNDIMKKVSGNYFNEKFINEAIISEAQKAYVVSPVSSLIVLETQKDYDRFGIEDSKDSLKNATMKSSGAVPEPHEWLLILLAASIVIYFMSKNYFGQKTQG